MERCPRAHGVERGTPGERLEIYWPYTHTGHTTSGHPATTLTGAVLPTKYRSVTRHITGSHGARVAQSAQVHQLPSAGAQQQQYCSPASAGHPPAVSLQRSGAGQSQAADVGRTHQERQECPVEGHANAITERVDLIQVGVQRISCTILEGSSNKACTLAGRSSAQCPVLCSPVSPSGLPAIAATHYSTSMALNVRTRQGDAVNSHSSRLSAVPASLA